MRVADRLPGSPALDHGGNPAHLKADQRGATRVENGIADIGAFEADRTFGAVSTRSSSAARAFLSAGAAHLAQSEDNGGFAPTHALLEDRPAIDRGSNPEEFEFDQRFGLAGRETGAAPDIGAFELDRIFYGGVD